MSEGERGCNRGSIEAFSDDLIKYISKEKQVRMNILVDESLPNGVHKWKGTSQEKEWTLFCGNAVDALKNVPDESVNCVITSPP